MGVIGFSNHAIDWFQSYLSNQLFRISLEKIYSKPSSITCGLLGSILGRLLFLIYVNDMPQLVKSDDSCLVFQGKNIKEIQKRLNEDFINLCDWFFRLGKDKTESILFVSKRKIKKVRNLIIKYKVIQIKQYSKVTYLYCKIDEALSQESMTLKIISKVNSRPKILHRTNKFLTPAQCRLLCNALIQTYFDFSLVPRYPNLPLKLEKENLN